jgi:hypothetical protein
MRGVNHNKFASMLRQYVYTPTSKFSTVTFTFPADYQTQLLQLLVIITPYRLEFAKYISGTNEARCVDHILVRYLRHSPRC